jgi:hypothetical protein
MSDIIPQSVIFGNETVEISYMEERDAEGPVMQVRTISVPGSLITDLLPELMEAVQAIVDSAAVIMRKPPERMVRGRPT